MHLADASEDRAGEKHCHRCTLFLWAVFLLLLVGLSDFHPARAESVAPQPQLFLYAVGIERHQDPHLPASPGAVSDVEAVTRLLDLQRSHLYGQVHVRVLTGEKVRHQILLADIEAFFRAAQPQDFCLILLEMHALRRQPAGPTFLMVSDTRVDRLEETALEQGRLMEVLSSLLPEAGRLLILADTLRAEALRDEADPLEQGADSPLEGLIFSELDRLEEVWPQDAHRFAQISAGRDVQIGASSPFPPSQGLPRHGQLVQALVETLEGRQSDRDSDGLLSGQELMDGLSRQIKQANPGSPLPELSGSLPVGPLFWAPGTEERCNRVDDDGDGVVDNGFDQDRDGYLSRARCGPVYGNDCDDLRPRVHPQQPDLINFLDDDCDGQVDEDERDVDRNNLPDSWERRSRQLSKVSWASAGLGLALSGASGWSYWQLQKLKGEAGDAAAFDSLVTRYQAWSKATAITGGGAVISFSVSGTFLSRRRAFDARCRRLRPPRP